MKSIFGAIVACAVLCSPLVVFADSTVTASAGTGASVSPSGTVVVSTGVTQTFTPSADSGYTLSSVVLDGVSQPVGPVNFTGIAADPTAHTLTVGATANAPTGGGTMPWCSGPMAPGWNVSLPGGGCGASETFVPLGGQVLFGGVTSQCTLFYGCMEPNKQ